jgi:hypothetical protein
MPGFHQPTPVVFHISDGTGHQAINVALFLPYGCHKCQETAHNGGVAALRGYFASMINSIWLPSGSLMKA